MVYMHCIPYWKFYIFVKKNYNKDKDSILKATLAFDECYMFQIYIFIIRYYHM